MRTKKPVHFLTKSDLNSLNQKTLRYAGDQKPTTSRLIRAAIKLLGDHRLGYDLQELPEEDKIVSPKYKKPVA